MSLLSIEVHSFEAMLSVDNIKINRTYLISDFQFYVFIDITLYYPISPSNNLNGKKMHPIPYHGQEVKN